MKKKHILFNFFISNGVQRITLIQLKSNLFPNHSSESVVIGLKQVPAGHTGWNYFVEINTFTSDLKRLNGRQV